MKIEIFEILNYFIGSFALSLSAYIIGSILLEEKIKFLNFKILFCTLLLSVANILNYFLIDGGFRAVTSYFIVAIYLKIVFNLKIKNSLLISFIILIVTALSEFILVIIISLASLLFSEPFSGSKALGNSYLINIFISFLTIILSCFVFKKRIINIAKEMSNNTKVYITIACVIILLIAGNIFVDLLKNDWQISKIFYFNMIIVLLLIIISGIIMYQETSRLNLAQKYEIANRYMKVNADLIEKYSLIQHQYKNQLILIKGYADKNNDKLLKYINELLKDYNYENYEWITKVNYINLDCLRYLIFHKLAEAEDLKLKIDVQISEKVKKIDFQNLNIKEINNLSVIIGEYLDNAIYASKYSKNKELCFDCYLEDESLVFEIVNSYKNKIDMKNINKKGYSTKGENRGLGLYDIDNIVKKNKIFSTMRNTNKYYFIAKINICLKK